MYRLLRPLLFLLPPEFAHGISLYLLKCVYLLGLTKWLFRKPQRKPVKCFGLTFKNPVGFAAGLDKNGDYLDCLASLGVGFIEVGGVTPRPQKGNKKPRKHRLVSEQALINWMGLNNKGVNYLVERLKKRKADCIIGANLSKGTHRSNDQAEHDYLYCLEKIYPYVDYVSINVSCPNSSNIESLQSEIHLERMLTHIIRLRNNLAIQYKKKLPLLLKLSPDLSDEQLSYIIKLALEVKLEGVVATNTSVERNNVAHHKKSHLKGGLSGVPLKEASRAMLVKIRSISATLPIISVGGINTTEELNLRLSLGASLTQLYTALVYNGPGLIRRLVNSILSVNNSKSSSQQKDSDDA